MTWPVPASVDEPVDVREALERWASDQHAPGEATDQCRQLQTSDCVLREQLDGRLEQVHTSIGTDLHSEATTMDLHPKHIHSITAGPLHLGRLGNQTSRLIGIETGIQLCIGPHLGVTEQEEVIDVETMTNSRWSGEVSGAGQQTVLTTKCTSRVHDMLVDGLSHIDGVSDSIPFSCQDQMSFVGTVSSLLSIGEATSRHQLA